MAAKGLSFFQKIVWFLNLVVVASLLLSYLSYFISPEKFWVIGLFGLAYPVFLILNILFCLFWLLAWKRWFLLSFLTLLLGFPYFNNSFQLRMKSPAYTKSREDIRILSFNVRLFDLYKWSGQEDTPEKIAGFLQKNNAGIVCLQEFYNSPEKQMDHEKNLKALLKNPFVHIEYTESVHKGHWGLATFSKFPIIGKGKIDFHTDANNMCIYTDLQVGEKVIRIYNVHLQSIKFDPEDYEFVRNIGDNREQEEITGSKKILKRLKVAFIKRARQVSLVRKSIEESPYPVLVCGDFNDTPSSYTYHQLKNNLKDAFVESGQGLGNTYNGIFPSFRIDYILHSEQLKAHDFRTHHKNLSDHYPITCTLSLK